MKLDDRRELAARAPSRTLSIAVGSRLIFAHLFARTFCAAEGNSSNTGSAASATR